MPKQIIWSPLSEEDFANILEYLHSEWGNKVVRQFIEITDKFLLQISENPQHFPLINKGKSIRKCVVTKHNSLYYRDSKSSIELLRIYDSRQDPKKLRFR